MNTTATGVENIFDTSMKAVIIYDKYDLALKARTTLERVAHRTGKTLHWSVKPWSVDILNLPSAAEAALAEAADAHLVVLAVRQVKSLAPWLVDWLERWAKCRQVQEAALGVCDGGNTDKPSAQAAPELLNFIGRNGLSLIFDDNPPVEDKSLMFARDLPEREVSLTPTSHQIMKRPVRDNSRHWGIND